MKSGTWYQSDSLFVQFNSFAEVCVFTSVPLPNELSTIFPAQFSNNGSRDIVTPKTMYNHNIISRNEKNRSKVVILQSFSVLSYLLRKWEHFQITKLNRVYMGSLALQPPFPIQILLIFLRFELPPNFTFQCYRPQTWQFYFFFSCSFHFWDSQSPKY